MGAEKVSLEKTAEVYDATGGAPILVRALVAVRAGQELDEVLREPSARLLSLSSGILSELSGEELALLRALAEGGAGPEEPDEPIWELKRKGLIELTRGSIMVYGLYRRSLGQPRPTILVERKTTRELEGL